MAGARFLSVLVLLGACEAKPPPATEKASAPAKLSVETKPPVEVKLATEAARATASERHFGAPAQLDGPPTPVAELLKAPEPYLGKTVKCEGKVARVCQNAGCWLELTGIAGGEGLRVPMAGHAFFIPQDAVGRSAVVEGALRRVELPASQREHYQSEGMRAVGPLALEATSVTLR